MRILILSLLTITLLSCSRTEGPEFRSVNLHDHWTFRQDKDTVSYPASVPGNIHTDLLEEGLIPDPFFGDNEDEVQWVGEMTWVYETRFLVPRAILEKERVEICFEGIDTYAEVSLNGSKVLVADNMFRTYRIDVKKLLTREYNTLTVKFSPAAGICSERAASHPYPLPDERGFLRKAPYQFGWDWGPRLVTCGIWKPVSLEGWNGARIISSFISTDHLGKEREKAGMNVVVEAESLFEQDVILKLEIEGEAPVEKKFRLQPGENILGYAFDIKDPRLWQIDDPALYHYTVTLSSGQSTMDSWKGRFGIRTLELVTEEDEQGESFYFKLNGKPVFAKGANMIPLDNFPTRVTSENYEKLVVLASGANMNMLRVWGGGIYEDDHFYDLCDEYGILVWQDFMFACNLYPGTDEFIDNVRQEAIDQLRRLRQHPSLALWCGNNEVDEGWHNWGWQEQLDYSRQDSLRAWGDYLLLFEDVLPDLVKKYDGTRDYWPSSPKNGWGRPQSLREGDMHYWGVWWGEEPFNIYNKKVGRFMSEYGFQGFPSEKTLEKYLLHEDLELGSQELENHQKHPRGMELINTYMDRDYDIPGSFGDYIYVSQLLQAEGMKMAIEAHRQAMPYCMGTLFWQFNDCWPAISWSAVDYDGRPKALYYYSKKAYDDLLLTIEPGGDQVTVRATSDLEAPLDAKLDVTLLSFFGDTLLTYSTGVVIQGNTSQVICDMELTGLKSPFDPSSVLWLAELTAGGGKEAKAIKYMVKPKELKLPVAEVSYATRNVPEGILLSLRSEMLVKNIYLDFPGLEGYFEENYFDLLPGRNVEVLFRTNDISPDPALRWRSL